jgi:exopolyphosphatase/guanosine-5'-triphosphate,3'-diphosphate pyrophosphatase
MAILKLDFIFFVYMVLKIVYIFIIAWKIEVLCNFCNLKITTLEVSMISAIVDMGSNTIKLCVYEYSKNCVKILLERKTMAGLANFVKNEKLSNKGVERVCEILKEYQDILNIFHIEENDIYIFATAPLRNITNTSEVVANIKKCTGYDVEVLSGEEEATLDFIGATKFIYNETGVLVDIGGGSTEIVVFCNKSIKQAISMPIGSLNLYVKYVKEIIPKEEERELIYKIVLDHLKASGLKQENYETICGVGGTIKAAAKLNNSIFNLPSNNINLETGHIAELLNLIKNSRKHTLTPILQNIPDRIHTIVPGLLILDTIAEYFNSEEIIVSKYGIREGYLYEKVMKGE